MKRTAIGMLCSLALGLLSCSRAPVMLVSIDRVPDSAASLQIFVTQTDASGMREVSTLDDLPILNLPRPAAARTSLVLELPRSYAGRLSVSAAAFAKPDAGGCILRIGKASHDFTPSPFDDSMQVSLDSDISDTECTGRGPRILSTTPTLSTTKGGGVAKVSGWGFRPGAVAQFDGAAAVPTTYQSASELSFDIPAATKCGVSALSVANPSGDKTAPYLGFRYRYSTLAYLEGSIKISNGILGLTYGQFDTDGQLDFVATPQMASTSLLVLLKVNQATGMFQTYPIGNLPTPASVADVDKDGDVDIISSDGVAGQIVVLRNDGKGIFSAPERYNSGAGAGPVAVADVNGDGYPDVAVANETARNVSLLLNNKSGGFVPYSSLSITRSSSPLRVALLDLNADGKLDLVIEDRSAPTLRIAFYDAAKNGYPSDDILALGVPMGGAAGPMSIGDLDGDGRPDLVVPVESTSAIRTFLSTDAQAIAPRQVATCTGPRAVTITDVDCDGRNDLAVVCVSGTKVKLQMLLQQNDRSFVEGYVFDLRSAIVDANDIAIGDASGDGRPDVAIASSYGISYLTNDSR